MYMFIRQNADQYTTQMTQPQERRQAHLPQTETADWQIHKSAFEAKVKGDMGRVDVKIMEVHSHMSLWVQ